VTWVRGMFACEGRADEHTRLGLTVDPLFVGATRPPLALGVTYSPLLVNGVFTMEIFSQQNLLTCSLQRPIHGISILLCARDARFFDLALLAGRTRIPALLANARLWKSVVTRLDSRFATGSGSARTASAPCVTLGGVRRP